MGTRHQGPADEVLALDVFVKLVRATEAVSDRVHGHLRADRLTVSQFGVLEALLHLGPMCQKELGSKLLRSGGNVTMVVDNLEKRGLVRRERRPENRKFVTVHLTEEGRALVRRVFPRHVEAVVRELSILSAAEQETLGRLLRTLGRGTPA
ncbi:MAG: MarR family transcriptional regulator [Planctomycetes bacterium]|nr:MarR family transcriptional regulator [Planctomycetota bacterium]